MLRDPATTARSADALTSGLIGDGLVPVMSALGRHKIPSRTLESPPGGNGSPAKRGTSPCSATAVLMNRSRSG